MTPIATRLDPYLGVIHAGLTDKAPEEERRLFLSRIPMGRMGRPDELAELVSWLASGRCSLSTGRRTTCLAAGRSTKVSPLPLYQASAVQIVAGAVRGAAPVVRWCGSLVSRTNAEFLYALHSPPGRDRP